MIQPPDSAIEKAPVFPGALHPKQRIGPAILVLIQLYQYYAVNQIFHHIFYCFPKFGTCIHHRRFFSRCQQKSPALPLEKSPAFCKSV
jgi:hypothetical protein